MIETEGLTKFYGPLAAIRDVTFHIERGEVVGFLGPNGAGKSTTIRILTCYMPATAGSARIDGTDCFEQSLEVRRKVGYLPENVPLYLDLTVRRFLRFAAGVKGINGKDQEGEISRVIGICGLEKVSHRILGHLSKGYRQRVGLAQALLNSPPVLILDEATSSIDTRTEALVERGMDKLMHGRTVFVIAHRLSTVRNADAIIVMENGKVIERGSHDDLIAKHGRYYQLYTGNFDLDILSTGS